jgi:sec-independent protein translocase protein TatB
VLRMVGQWMGKARRMAAEFQGQFQEAMREAEMADLKKTFDDVKEAATGFASDNVMTSLQKDVGEALRIDDIDKPAALSADTPAAISADDTHAVPTTPAISKIEALEPPIPETFTEADAHAAAMEPLAITREVQPQPAPQDITPAAPDILKDAKAS